VSYNPFVEGGIGHLEFRLCELLHRTPREIGDLRRKSPVSIAFLERHIVWEAKEKEKHYKEMERKSKTKKGRRR